VLKQIVHDWEDDDAAAILDVVRRSAPAGARVLVVERDLGPPNESLGPKLSDLNMLVVPGGRERSVDEYAALFEAAGLDFAGAVPSAEGISVYEANVR
jgi:hypothetical protein